MQERDHGAVIPLRQQRFGQSIEGFNGVGIDFQRGFPLGVSLIHAMELTERHGQDQMRLQHFGDQLDRLLQRADGFFGVAGKVKTEANLIVELWVSGFKFEAGAKRLEYTVVLPMISEPSAQLDVTLCVRRRAQFGLQFRRRGAVRSQTQACT